MHLLTSLTILKNMARNTNLFRDCFFLLISVVFVTAVNTQIISANDLSNAKVKPVTEIKAYPFDLQQVRLLDSPFKTAMELDGQYLLMLDPDIMCAAMQKRLGEKPKTDKEYGGWHFGNPGPYISACALMYASTDDEKYKQRVDYIVNELARIQKAYGDGFLGCTQTKGKLITNIFNATKINAGKWNVNDCGNFLYGEHFVFCGLLDAYVYTGNKKALDVAANYALWFKKGFDKMDDAKFQAMLATEHGGMVDSMARLYELTGRKEFLKLAKRFDHKRDTDPLARREDELTGLHANTTIPKITGTAVLNEMTGSNRYETICTYFWDQVVGPRMFVTGGSDFHEHYREPGTESDFLAWDSTETCCVYNMLKLTRHLFAWNPDAKYMDFYERALYNHILGSQDTGDPGHFTYFYSLKPGHFKIFSTQFDSMWCCVETGIQNHAKYGESIYFHNQNTLWVNLFIPSKLDWKEKGVTLTQTTDFPSSDTMTFSFSVKRPVDLALKIRVPHWAVKGVNVTVNSKKVPLQSTPGSYLTLSREWHDGDTVKVTMALSLQLYHARDDKHTVAVLYGPVVLAGELGREGMPDSVYCSNHKKHSNVLSPPVPVLVTDSDDPSTWIKKISDHPLKFTTVNAAKPKDVTLIPIADVHHQRYTVYWTMISPREWKARPEIKPAAVSKKTLVPGLAFSYFQGAWKQLPDFKSLEPVKTGSTGNFKLAEKERNDNFGLTYSGYLEINQSGAYSFAIRSDDGHRFSLGGHELLCQDGIGIFDAKPCPPVSLQPGFYPIEIEFFEGQGGEFLELFFYAPDGSGWKPVSSSMLYHRKQQADYDYFRNAIYPGNRRPDVSLERVKQEDEHDASGAYNKRVVHWWPKKGVDVVDPPEGVELRTWTIRTPEVEPLIEASAYSKWWPASLRYTNQFKAHLLGFRGIGSTVGYPFAIPIEERVCGKGMCPAIVLRLEDGRKRCFTRGSFIDEDQDYILDLYRKEMDRLRTTQAPPPANLRPGLAREWPQCELYTPGTFRLESDFFVFVSGSQGPLGEFSAWVNEDDKDRARQYREATVRHFEDYWAYLEYAGQRKHYWNEPESTWCKYIVKVPGTRKDGFGVIPGFAGGGRGACEIKDASWPALYHEWAHGSPSSTSLGGGEVKTDSHQPLADPMLIAKVEHQIQRPFMNLFHGWYPGGLGWTMMGDDPNWGYAAVASLNSMGSGVATPMHMIAKLGQERGIWKDGIRGVGDFFGQMGARFAEYDWELEAELRATFPAPDRACLVALDRKAGLYRSDPVEAPEPFGVNIVRLTAEPDAKKISIDFRGHFDPDTYSDWRACIVAVDKDGRCRYSPLWNKGLMNMDTRPGDKRYWLTVTATPYALANAGKDGKWYGSPYAYKYPYDVQLSGCRPASPHTPVGVNENMDLIGPRWAKNAITGGQRSGAMDWPHPSDTPEYAKMKASLELLREKAPDAIKAHLAEGLYGGRPPERTLMVSALLTPRANWLLENAQGSRHPNGGGWVANSATVAPTAYVGPDCMVLDGATVLDRAIIEDYAIVSGEDVVVKDNARVYGKAIVCGAAELSGYARVSRNIINRNCTIEFNPGNTNVPFNAEIMASGMVKRSGPELRRFVFDGFDLGLQANYEFDQQEAVLMEDYYQEHGNDDTYLQELVFYNGVLYGQPGFVKDGDIRAVTFNGKDQYAEAAATVADLGQITVDISLKWKGGADQTIFDFGTSEDNCFKLVLPASGKPELQVRANGKSETVASRSPVAKGVWETVRVEIDGKTIRLWLNNEKVAETESRFRAADVYPAGAEKRNFIAAARGGKNPYCGALDYVHIFHVVHEDFSRTPEVPLVSSRRINPDYPRRFATKYADYELKALKLVAEYDQDELYRFYKDFYEHNTRRKSELQHSDEVDRLEKELLELTSERDRRKKDIEDEFDSRPETPEKLARFTELKQRYDTRQMEIRKQYEPELAELSKKRNAASSIVKEIEDTVRAKHAAELAANQLEIDALRKAYDAYLAGLLEKNPDAKKIQEKLRAAEEELSLLDQQKDHDRYERVAKTIKGFEQHLREIRNRFNADQKARDIQNRREKREALGRAIISAEAGLDPRYVEAAKMLERNGVIDRRWREIERTLIPEHPDLVAIKNEMDAIDPVIECRNVVEKDLRDIGMKIKAMEARIGKARQDAAVANNWDEFNALPMGWTERQQYDAIERMIRARKLPFITEYEKRFDAAFASQQAKWHTKVDWDDRLDWEKIPFQELSPTVQNWLKRTKPYVYK